MSMTLKRIELWNIRCHEHLQFIPDFTGITSVSGANGSGKSTIVDAFAWAMYGTKTNGVRNKMLIREGINPKEHLVRVEVEIIINKIEYLIQRTIIGEGGGSDCNVYGRSAGSELAFNHLAGPAISSAESYIKQITNMDEKGFLTAVLIQQKQVDQIVAASPRERGEVIEKLTGIQSISNAITLAKEEAKTLQKAANVITLEDVVSLEARIKEEIVNGTTLKQSLVEIEETISAQRKLVQELEEEYNRELKLNQESKVISNTLDLRKQTLSMQKSQLNNFISIVEDYRKEQKTIVVEDVSKLEESLNAANKLHSLKENKISSLKNEKTRLEVEKVTLNQELKDVDEDVEKILPKLKEEYERALEEKEALHNHWQVLKGEENQIKKSLATIDDNITECPVCKSHIDNPEDLRKEIESEIKKIKSQVKDEKDKVKRHQLTLDELSTKIKHTENLLLLTKRKEEVEDELIKITCELEKLIEENSDAITKLKVINNQYKNALKIASRADEVQRAKLRVKELNVEIANTDDEISLYSEKLSTLNAKTDREIAGIRRKYDDEVKSLNRNEIDYNKKNERLKFLRIHVEDLKKQFFISVEANKRYTELTNSMKRANVASSLMSEFKEDRIKVAIPALEMYASTILSKFTDGKFVTLSLDSKFNASVITDNGSIRPIAQLSGGELSAAAIALRIGISMLLNDGDNNVLVLDEILVSMDETRARHIIETITNITNCQVIFIAHNADIQEIADKTFSV